MKRILPIICTGAAFLAVSLWVWLSKGKSAKTVKTKFRLGGVLLTLISSMSISGCGGSPVVTCYDTPNTDTEQNEQNEQNEQDKDETDTEGEDDKK